MTKEGKILKALSGFYYVDCSGEVILVVQEETSEMKISRR